MNSSPASGHAAETDDLHRRGRRRVLHALTTAGNHRADTAIRVSSDNHVAHMQRAVLHQRRRDGAAGMIQLRLDDDAACLAVRVGLEFQHIGQKQHVFEQIVDALAGLSGNVHHDGVAAHSSGTSS